MNKNILSAAVPMLLALAMTACKGEATQKIETRVIEDVDSVTGIVSLRDYTYDDTITVAGHTYRYSYTLEHVDTMRTVVNPQGIEYQESRVRISVKQGDRQIFNKTYYKRDFRDFVPRDILSTSTMVGVNYNFTKRDEDRSALYFIVTVGDPDETSDMAYPLELKVMPDGSSSIKKAENLETESLNPGLNVDPSEDAI